MIATSAIRVRKLAELILVLAYVTTTGFISYRTMSRVITDVSEGARSDIRDLRRFDPIRMRDWKDLPEKIEQAWGPRVEGRDLMVRRFARFKLDTLGVSPTPRVWIGENNWLFYNHEAESNYYSVTDPKLNARLAQWIVAWPKWHEWLKARGIRLLIVVAPDKQSIYSEYLPSVERKRDFQAPFDRMLLEFAKHAPDLPIVDLRGPLRRAKSKNATFFKSDTHWEPRGAYEGYLNTVRGLGIEPLPPTAFRSGPTVRTEEGDLATLLDYWPHPFDNYEHMELISPNARRVPVADDPNDITRLDYLEMRLYEQPNSKLPRAVLFHDSFGKGFYSELLAEHFSRLLAVPSNHMDPEVIEREKPDIVILELVERLFQGIGTRLPTDPPRRSLNG